MEKVMWYAIVDDSRISMFKGEELDLPDYDPRRPLFLGVEFD